jgi:hypothetical protein
MRWLVESAAAISGFSSFRPSKQLEFCPPRSISPQMLLLQRLVIDLAATAKPATRRKEKIVPLIGLDRKLLCALANPSGAFLFPDEAGLLQMGSPRLWIAPCRSSAGCLRVQHRPGMTSNHQFFICRNHPSRRPAAPSRNPRTACRVCIPIEIQAEP